MHDRNDAMLQLQNLQQCRNDVECTSCTIKDNDLSRYKTEIEQLCVALRNSETGLQECEAREDELQHHLSELTAATLQADLEQQIPDEEEEGELEEEVEEEV